MAWTYEVRTKRFYHNGTFRFEADYAGAPGYKNDSAFECLKDRGPLPRGSYTIGEPRITGKTGKYSLPLSPHSSNAMCGRNAFLIHGDKLSAPGEASTGCIVIGLSSRKNIWTSGDRELIVI